MTNIWHQPCENTLIPKGRPFIKMHGLKNDFVIVDGRRTPFEPTVENIVKICDRHEGVGADQLLIVNPPKTDNTYAFVRIVNPDGREVGACGNATRCVGWLLMQEAATERVCIQTLGGILTCLLAGDKQVQVEMGKLRTKWQEIPLSRQTDTLHLGIEAGPLKDPVGMNIGNPHAVFFVDDLASIDLTTYGKALQNNSLFPKQANIGVAQVVNPSTLRLDVWERPGKITTACGSGACAAVGAAIRRGLTDRRKMTVIMPAGSLDIEIKDNKQTVMTGPVDTCFTGFLPPLRSQCLETL